MITKTIRGELYSSVDLLAKIGGIIGVVLGMSLVSILELIYYSSLYPILRAFIRKFKNDTKIVPLRKTQLYSQKPRIQANVPLMYQRQVSKAMPKRSLKDILLPLYTSAINCVSSYLNNCTIAGVKHLTNSQTTRFERFLWFLVLSVLIWLCYVCVNIIWGKISLNPLMVTFGTEVSTYDVRTNFLVLF